jgi:hypothetical protein
MNLFILLVDTALALAAAYILYPVLVGATATSPTVFAVLIAAGIILTIYGDRVFPD